MGGIDWSGLENVVDHLGIDDMDGLMLRLLLIKEHRPAKDDA